MFCLCGLGVGPGSSVSFFRAGALTFLNKLRSASVWNGKTLSLLWPGGGVAEYPFCTAKVFGEGKNVCFPEGAGGNRACIDLCPFICLQEDGAAFA